MSVIRIQKSKNFTTMSNIHLRDKELSLKAKGLMSVMLSLPDDWSYSVAGLCAICKEKETAVKNTLNELRERRYVIVERIDPSEETGGRIQYEYFVYEQPQGEENKKVDVKEVYKARQGREKQHSEKQGVENLVVDFLPIENLGGILNTNKPNTDELKRDKLNTDNHSLSSKRASESIPSQPKKQSRKKEANELFERLWKLYPKKLGKGQVSDTQKLKLLEIGYDELSRAIQRCCLNNKDRDKQYWQNGSTFFNSGYIDFLDENYEDSSSFSSAEMNKPKKEPLSERERIRLGIEKARETFGEEYGESYWNGMDDGEIEIMLEYLGIRINEF